MPLINLVNETKLRSIPFGNDKPDGGSSNAPLIKTDLPRIDEARPLNFKDNFIRGGGPLTLRSALEDTFRLSKYMLGITGDARLFIVLKDFDIGYNIKGYDGFGLSGYRFGKDDKGSKTLLPQLQGSLSFQKPNLFGDFGVTNVDGILFTIKQNVLSRSSVFVRDGLSRLYTPLSTLANAAGGAIGLHFQKEGLNPFKGLIGGYINLGSKSLGYYTTTYSEGKQIATPTDNTKRFINKSAPNQTLQDLKDEATPTADYTSFSIEDSYWTDATQYQYGTLDDDGNELKQPADEFQNTGPKTDRINFKYPSDKSSVFKNRLTLLYQTKVNPFPTNFRLDLAQSLYGIKDNRQSLVDYTGGPNSLFGVGSTNIRMIGLGYGFPDENTFSETFVNSIKYNLNKQQNIYSFDYTLFNASKIVRPSGPIVFSQNGKNILVSTGIGKISDFRRNLNKYNSLFSDQKPLITYIDPNINSETNEIKKNIPDSNYIGFNRELTYLEKVKVTKTDQVNQDYLSPNSSLFYDFVTATGPIKSSEYLKPYIEELKYKDIIKFNFEVINNDNKPNDMLFFKAYVNSISDNYKAEWNQYKYVGRAENLYKYSSFNRDGQISFIIYAHSRAEMRFIYKKINLLVATTAPSYSSVGMMRGNIVRMTIGDYYNHTPVIINNISLKPNFEAGWDIDRDDLGAPFKRPNDYHLEESLYSNISVPLTSEDRQTYINNQQIPPATKNITSTFANRNIGATSERENSAIYTGPLIDNTNNELYQRGKWVGQLPRMIEVDLSFTVLHDFAPRYNGDKQADAYGGINFIANETADPTTEIYSSRDSTSTLFDTAGGVVRTLPDPNYATIVTGDTSINNYYYYYGGQINE